MFLQRIAMLAREDSDSVRYLVNVCVISGSVFRDIYKRVMYLDIVDFGSRTEPDS